MQKKIYLTIDDSPSSSFRSNLDYLISNNIPAVFFCIGNLMQAHWDDILYAIEQGYMIGNHSYTHPHFSDITLEDAKREIRRTDKLIDKAYREAGVEYYDRLFRFPYGDKGNGKYGFHFMEFKKANKLRQGRWAKFKRKLRNINPIYRMMEGNLEALGSEKSFRIQQYLFQMGYVRGDLIGVEYDFFHPLATDQDWSWSFDIGEWQWDGKQSENDFLTSIYDRLDDTDPHDFRGEFAEQTGMQNKEHIDLVLFHDRDATNTFFKPVLDYLLKMGVQFLPIDYDQIKMK